MVVPDYGMIAEIMLVSEGFSEARLLARKFITLYILCRDLLSKQDHYDWKLRAIKTTLNVAGGMKRDAQTVEGIVAAVNLHLAARAEFFVGLSSSAWTHLTLALMVGARPDRGGSNAPGVAEPVLGATSVWIGHVVVVGAGCGFSSIR